MQTQSRRDFLNFAGYQPPAEAYWLHVYRTAMACRFEVTLPCDELAGVTLATGALDEVDQLESQLTIFRETSEVSRINRQAATEPVRVEESLFNLLLLCRRLLQQTNGAFDITSGPLTRCWGFLRRDGRLPTEEEIERARYCVGSDKLILDQGLRTIRFGWPGVEINLGSIGKGHALDRAAALIGDHLKTALLNAGASSIRAIGDGGAGHGGWTVGLRDPLNKKRRLGMLRASDCAISTSGSEEQFFDHNGKRYGHIIDPRTGRPSELVISVSVVAPSAAVSDALATAFFVGGRELAEAYCSTHEDVLVIMLERGSAKPIMIGKSSRCEVFLAPYESKEA